MSGYIRKPEEKILWFESGGICYLCHTNLTFIEKANTYGEQAHIYGENPTSARYDEIKSNDKNFVNTERNLMLACPSCHKKIDKTHVDDYPVERLFKIKDEHESMIRKAISDAILKLDSSAFSELNEVFEKFVLPSNVNIENINMPIPPNKKINKNGLSEDVHKEILMAFSQVDRFRDFLNNHPKLEFAVKLRGGFTQKYFDLFDKGFRGDDIYYELKIFATGRSMLLKKQIGAIILLAYYFQSCDIFES